MHERAAARMLLCFGVVCAHVQAVPDWGVLRPMRCIASLNSCRSSAMRMAPSLAPMSSTLWRSSTPDCEMGRKGGGGGRGGRAGFGGNARERAWCAKGSYAARDANARRRRWRRGSCSHLGEGDGEVERRLAAHGGQQRIRLLLLFATPHNHENTPRTRTHTPTHASARARCTAPATHARAPRRHAACGAASARRLAAHTQRTRAPSR